MEDIIREIMKIESRANALANETEREKEELYKKHEEELKKIYDETLGKAKDKIEAIRKAEFRELQVDIENLKKEKEKKLEEMITKANKKSEKWVDSIYENIIRGD